MATPRQIRSRIRVAKNIQQITKAMKMVAAARLRRAQEAVSAARPYAEKMQEVMYSLAGRSKGLRHPLLRKPVGEPKNIGVILITGDRGLCGSYNSAVIKLAAEAVRTYGTDRSRLITVGKKGAVFFRRRGFSVVSEHAVPTTGVSFAEAQELARTGRDLFADGEIDALVLVYTRFITAMTNRPTVTQLLPIENLGAPGASDGPTTDIIFEPDPDDLLGALLPRYIDTLVYQAVLESVTSEHGARMTSMSAATDNAGKMISSLTLSLNRARQATITKEIAEIVGGAEALK
jgi:F-type H+-transporting ATPase subunit gamma